MKRALSLLVVLFSLSAFAAERTEKQQLLAELLELLDVKALTQAAFDGMLNGLTDSGAESEDLPPEERAAAEAQSAREKEEMQAFRNRLYERMDFARYGELVYAPVFERSFNADELRALIAFLKTKPGQKLIAALPEIGTAGFLRGAKLVDEASRQTHEEMAKEEEEKYPWRKAMQDIRKVATALEARATDESSYPDVDFEALEPLVTPIYLRAMPKLDPWGTPYLYLGNAEHYRLVSAGADRRFEWSARQFETFDSQQPPPTRLSGSLDKDIIFQDGTFTQMPKVAQEQ